ncbi:MAG: DUF308 domain-containing protein [Olsenella sp.]|jgi:uncharacterized membrane protein HdeD (DUF308 family)
MKIEQSKAVRVVGGAICILLGVAVLSNPLSSMLTITKLLGWAVLVFGVVSLAAAFTNLRMILSQAELYVGILCTLLGLAIVAQPGFFVAWVFLLLGVFVMVTGLNSLFAANASRALGLPGANAGLVGAVAAIVFGAFVMFAPYATASFAMIVCGVALVYAGAVSVVNALREDHGR